MAIESCFSEGVKKRNYQLDSELCENVGLVLRVLLLQTLHPNNIFLNKFIKITNY